MGDWRSHVLKAEDLMGEATSLRRFSTESHAAGSNIRARWAKRADELMAEAQVHATLAVANRPLDEQEPTDD